MYTRRAVNAAIKGARGYTYNGEGEKIGGEQRTAEPPGRFHPAVGAAFFSPPLAYDARLYGIYCRGCLCSETLSKNVLYTRETAVPANIGFSERCAGVRIYIYVRRRRTATTHDGIPA